jgi:D-alanyl-D-alanine carboxypeptidase
MELTSIGRRSWVLVGLGVAGLALAACGGASAPAAVKVSTPAISASVAQTSATAAPAKATAAAQQTCAAFAQASDPYLLRVVDKERGLPADYRPGDLQAIDDRWAVAGFAGQVLRAPAAGALVEMLAAAQAQGITLRTRSSFRSYAEQQRTFQFWIDRLGEAQAKRESAPPGHSEHQLGTTTDVISASVGWELIEAFGPTIEGKWVTAHAHEFGFAISYPPDGEAVTGYVWEPWHIRYIGKPCAAEWKSSGLVLVRFLERLAAPTR